MMNDDRSGRMRNEDDYRVNSGTGERRSIG